MKRLGQLIWKYFVPLMVLLLALQTYFGDPDEPITKSIPIVPGEYQTQVAIGLAILGVVLTLIIWRHDPQQASKE